MSARKITRIALLSAILYVSKMALEFLPNVEMVSFSDCIYPDFRKRDIFDCDSI